MSESTDIILADKAQLPVFAIAPAALAQRDEALATAALIGKVENAAQNEAAVRAHVALKRITSAFEKARKAMKEPLLEAGRQLDRTVARESEEAEKECGRLGNLTAGFALAERRRIAEEEELQRREVARIEAEKQAELLRIAREQAEAERVAREAALAAAKMATEAVNTEQRAAAEAARVEGERLAAEAAAKAQSDAQRVQESADSAKANEAKPILPTRAAGQVVKTDWLIHILNPYDLAKYHPDCVEITPRTGQIKRLLNEGFAVKGIRAEKITTSTVRAGKEHAAIDV